MIENNRKKENRHKNLRIDKKRVLLGNNKYILKLCRKKILAVIFKELKDIIY